MSVTEISTRKVQYSQSKLRSDIYWETARVPFLQETAQVPTGQQEPDEARLRNQTKQICQKTHPRQERATVYGQVCQKGRQA